jgi:hypothetical protein
MAAAFRDRSPLTHVAGEPIECSRLLAEAQSTVIGNVAALSRGGRSPFTSPGEACTWADLFTGRPSVSPGPAAYEVSSREVGLTSVVSTGTMGTTV